MSGETPSLDEGIDKSAAIYQAAARIFHEKGYHATSINEIADAVQLTKAGLYYYIRGKQELLFGIMSYAMDQLEMHVLERARGEQDPETRLRTLITAHGRLITADSSALTILVNELEGLTHEQRREIVGRQRAYMDFIRSTLEALRAEGRLRDIDSTVGAFSILGMVLWTSRWYRPDGRLSRDQVIDEIANIALGAVVAERGSQRAGTGFVETLHKELP